jgi:lysophospholipase L1-like esterase
MLDRTLSLRALSRMLALVVALVAAAAPAAASRIVVFGDSWAVPAAGALQQVLNSEGIPETVYNAGVVGQTAAFLSSPTGLASISTALAANPDADLIHLSIGGNDLFAGTALATIVGDAEAIVDHILSLRPGASILWSSYDYPRPVPGFTPAEVNAVEIQFGVLAQALAASTPGLTFGDFLGLMQTSYGFDGVQYTPYDPAVPIAPGDPSLPNSALPGPYAAYADTIHLTPQGYLVLAQAQYDSFYALHLVPEPGTGVLLMAGLLGLAWRRERAA